MIGIGCNLKKRLFESFKTNYLVGKLPVEEHDFVLFVIHFENLGVRWKLVSCWSAILCCVQVHLSRPNVEAVDQRDRVCPGLVDIVGHVVPFRSDNQAFRHLRYAFRRDYIGNVVCFRGHEVDQVWVVQDSCVEGGMYRS